MDVFKTLILDTPAATGVTGAVSYLGTWNATTNSPTLANPPSASTQGNYYVVSTAGTQFSISFAVGDWIISNGSIWEKVDLTDSVSSVFSRTGAVVGVSTDYSSVGITNTAIGTSNPSTVAATTITASSTIAATGAVTGSNLSGTNTGDQTITLTGGVTGSGTGSFAATVITNANLTGGVTSVGNAATVVTNANLTGDVTSVGNATTLTNAPVIAKVLTGYTSGAGTVAATDSILQAIQKLNGNDATNANLTGVITSVGNATSIASQTGTGTKFVVDTSPVLVTPNIGIATGTSLAAALNGTLGATTPSSVAATTGTFSSTLGVTGVATLGNGAILGTPASGTVTNLTGTASININGTVGATTPSTVAATTIVGSGSAIFGNTSTPSTSVGGTQINNPASVGPSIFSQAAATANRWIDFMGSSTTVASLNNNSGVFSIAASSSGAEINVSGTQRGLFSSTGLAVTGAVAATTVAATGNITTSAGNITALAGEFQVGSASKMIYLRTLSGSNRIDSYNNPITATVPLGINSSELTLVIADTTRATLTSTGLAVTGAITATGNITAYYSDDRLKTKLGNIENALDKVCSLDGFYYEANETAQTLGYKPMREVGLSAQSVQKVLPEVIAPAPIDPQYLTMHYERVVPLLVEAIKELRAEISALKKGNC
jgi:hypothetical protein